MRRHTLQAVTLAGVAAILAGLVYRNALHNPFVYDDAVTIVYNVSLRDLTNLKGLLLGSLFRPVTNLSFVVDHAFWGTRPIGYHVTSVLLHMLNAALLFGLTWRAVEDWQARDPIRSAARSPAAIAFTAAALFAVHPMMTEAVGYISGRSEVLCGTFFLLSLLAMRKGIAEQKRVWLALGLVFAVVAIGSREVAVMLPFVLLVYDQLLLGNVGDGMRRRLLWLYTPLFAFVLVAGAIRTASFLSKEATGSPRAFWRYIASQFEVVCHYLSLLIAPVFLSIVHDVRPVSGLFDGPVLVAAMGLVSLCALAFLVRKAEPLATLGVAWTLLLLVPSSLVPLDDAMAEHRVYLASAGIFIAFGAGFGRLLARLEPRGGVGRAAAAGGLTVVLLVLAGLTVARNRVWADPVTLWRDAARKAPMSWSSHFGLATALADKGDCRDAVPEFQTALRRSPRPPVFVNLGGCLIAEQRPDEARHAFEMALAIDPRYGPAHFNLGLLDLRVGDLETAHRQFLQSITGSARDAQWRRMLVPIYDRWFDPAKTLEVCREIYRVDSAPWVTACIANSERRIADTRVRG